MTEAIIRCHQLSHFYSAKAALNKVSFEVSTGGPIGLVGPNGAGKSTLLSILSGFIRPTSGSVTLFGYQPGSSALSGKISALPQDARLDPAMTIGEQLYFYARLQGLGSKEAKNESIRVLEAVKLKDILHEKPVTLSHGMGKRVSIAQALIGSPQLILLDEPMAGLDPVNMRNIRSIISEFSDDICLIISSHDMTELGRLCQDILILDNGILNTIQLSDTKQNNSTRFITLQMESCPANDVIATLQQLSGVIEVTNPQKNEYIVEYNPTLESKMDIKILNCLSDNQWHYRQLSLGKSLEEKLFFGSK